MFTGLVVERGLIRSAEHVAERGGMRCAIGMSSELAASLEIGASLAVSGCCLTIVALEESRDDSGQATGIVELSAETLQRTTLGSLAEGSRVNLEPALRMGQPLGGHWVQGHVDGVLEFVERDDQSEFSTFWWKLPAEHAATVVEKGSVTIDGVSLTVAALRDDRFSVALIPHTLEVTTLGTLTPGDRSNFEVDVLAKYVERALAARFEASPASAAGSRDTT